MQKKKETVWLLFLCSDSGWAHSSAPVQVVQMNLFLQQERTDNTRFSPRRHTKHARHTHIQHTQTLRNLSKCCALGHNFGAGATKCRLLLSQPYLKDTIYYMLCTQKVRGEGVLKLYHSFYKQQA